MKKFKISLMVALVCLSLSTSAFAVTAPGDATAPVVLNADAATFDVTVPMNLPITMDASGVVVTATDAKIVNNSPNGGVVVTNVVVTPETGWVLKAYDDVDYASLKVNTKTFGFMINSENVAIADGKPALAIANWPVIPCAAGELLLTYGAKLGAQSVSVNSLTVGSVVFTIGWDVV